jgi:hypothetical protein
MKSEGKPVTWLLIVSIFTLNLQGVSAQQSTNAPAERAAGDETIDSGKAVPQGTGITSRRDASSSIPPVQTSVTRDFSKSEVAVNWENVTLKDCIEVLSRDLGMEFIISPSVNVTQEVSIRAGWGSI